MNQPLLIEHRKGVCKLTLNRPASRNALDRAMAQSLLETITNAGNDSSVRCIIITGSGESFCSGGDVKMFAEVMGADRNTRSEHFELFAGQVHQIITALRQAPKPALASTRGAVAGFGISLAMACDITISSNTSFFTLAYARMGLSPDGGSTYFLPRLVGERRARELALLADRFDAQTALSYGLINSVVDDKQLEMETEKLGLRLASGPTQAYANAKSLFNTSWLNSLDEQLSAEATKLGKSTATSDFEEAVAAFISKRTPKFTGQ